MAQQTNVVLVHGAWADGSSWSKVIPLLQRKGSHPKEEADFITLAAESIASSGKPEASLGLSSNNHRKDPGKQVYEQLHA